MAKLPKRKCNKNSLNLTLTSKLLLNFAGQCPDGGIGRHVRLKIWWPHGRAGSSPAPGTTIKSRESGFFLTQKIIKPQEHHEVQASSISTKTFNARIETASVKPSFRDALKTKRCLVLADGFFEWQTEGSLKTPHYIYKEDNDPFAFAGLWSEWVNRQTG